MIALADSKEELSPKIARERILAKKVRSPIHVAGLLDLSGCVEIKKLPDGLSCYELNVSGTSITCLPDDLQIESSLILRSLTSLETLPDGLVLGTLDLQGCSKLKALPNHLDVWFLNMRGCMSLEVFPSTVKVRNGALWMGGCSKLKEVPKQVTKIATLDISDCPLIYTLPARLEIGQWIDIGGSGVTSLKPPNDTIGIRWRGVTIDSKIAFQPELLKAEMALKERNAERRRVMIERMGVDRFMAEAKAKVLDTDKDPGGPRQLLQVPLENDEDIVVLSCRCPSTQRHYLLRVPPTMKSCHQAAAWMAGFDDPKLYKPLIET